MRTTLVIPTYQRRVAVGRLLDGIASQAHPELDVVVVVDGSTDGTLESLLARVDAFPIRLRVVHQRNAGLSAARNAGLAAIDHEGAAWLLDDDMIAGPDLVRRHVTAHDGGEPSVVMGPCRIPLDHRVVHVNRDWYDHVHKTLTATGVVDRLELFSAANTSAPVEVWSRVGGFHDGFVGWGGEDYELALRLFAAGIPVRYDAEAVAFHLQHRGVVALCGTKQDEGANSVRLAMLHPDQVDVLFPGGAPGDIRVLRRLRRRPVELRAVARVAAVAAAVEQRAFGGRRHRVLDFAIGANRLAGVAGIDRDGGYVSRLLDATPARR